MNKFFNFGSLLFLIALVLIGGISSVANADHSWGGYHWARVSNPFTLKLGDNLIPAWDTYLQIASNDWSRSNVLDTAIVPGLTNSKNCRATNGRVEVCNSKYGNNGWLGIASVWVNGSHITQGTVKLNDTYFNTAKYNTPAWKKLVTCQEVAHTFGLDHQDEIFDNTNLGTCMDYTSDPDGTIYHQLSNEHPNQHDYDELDLIYSHVDSFNSFSSALLAAGKTNSSKQVDIDTSNQSEWGRSIRTSGDGNRSLYVRELGDSQKVFTFVIWAD